MMEQNVYTLVNPQNGNLAFRLLMFEDDSYFDHIQRNNYYSLIWVTKGNGRVKADLTEYCFEANLLFAFSPYQPFMMIKDEILKGFAIQFHPDFFCIHKHQVEVACNGVLFNNIYAPPFVTLNDKASQNINLVIEQIKNEMQNAALAQFELLVSYLKILLIVASRLKTEQEPSAQKTALRTKEPFVLQNLKDAIESNFRSKHSASEYAELLNISSSALAKMTKNHFNKTLTSLITERIIIEANRELYLTNKAVKEIAHELGYQDEYYFSRLFKVNADISPQMYRNTVGFNRAQS
jgi:AraC-like DNA-binding protein